MKINQVKQIIKLGRLHFLIAGFLLYLLGVLLAFQLYHEFSWERFIWGYAVFLPAHLMVNYSNEFYDVEVDQISQPTPYSGGSGILVKHPELKSFAYYFSLTMMITSLLLGLGFSIVYNSPVFLFITISGNLLGWFYTAPPIKLSYRGLGEIATVLTGFLMPGLGYAAIIGIINVTFILFSIPLMLFLLLFILSVEIPDREVDMKGGKITFIVRYGRINALILMVLASALASLSFLILPRELFNPINLYIIALMSIIPLISAIYTWISRKSSLELLNKLATRNVSALILFLALVNLYIYLQ